MVIFLVGYMGSGKSSIGKHVAREIGWQFVDMDRLIERREGMTISEIFEREGEEYFRELERKMLFEFAQHQRDGHLQSALIATGGGVPIHDNNMEIMNRIGRTLYLKLSHKKLFYWLKEESEERPLLKGKDSDELFEFIKESLTSREEYYSKATHTVDCDELSDEQACQEVKSAILKMGQ